ncbi:major royal jelly protein 2-like [Hyposmocoma kahamanoa]|uniref:major royal jelly protein 2-like n=1 Tax=Hyposmocoma kahamanoa TaxID=1477025 RepID=UPI000E6D7DA4|nr:major royal jelly protein 2-like [Hyposmocoma kahamanoa]
MIYKFGIRLFLASVLFRYCEAGFPRNLAWTGGPVHTECEHSAKTLISSGQYIKDNVVATKAVTFNDDVYILTPRFKSGVLSTIWLIVRGRRCVELQPFPEQHSHSLGDCNQIQNAIDFYLDYLGNLWILDSGIVETSEHPRCTCRPKVVVLSILLKKFTKQIQLSGLVVQTSNLQNIVVEHAFGGPFVYISDASRGAILVHDASSGEQRAVLACAPTLGLHMALVKKGLVQSVLVLTRMQDGRVLEVNTNALKRKEAGIALRVYSDNSTPLIILGADTYHLYLRHATCADVLSWDTREHINSSLLMNIHSAGPRMIPTSVTAHPLKPVLLILDNNYVDATFNKMATYHRITFVGQL